MNRFQRKETNISLKEWIGIIVTPIVSLFMICFLIDLLIEIMKRELIGYKLKEECDKYMSVALMIANISFFIDDENGEFAPNSNCHRRLKEAGVMHWFEEVYKEEKLEVGRWYKNKEYYSNDPYCKGLYFLEYIDESEYNPHMSYGFNGRGDWTKSLGRQLKEFIPATEEEVKEALIKEAKRRGFKKGVKFYSARWDNGKIGDSNNENWRLTDNKLCMNRLNGIVFYNGKWAEIIEDPKKDAQSIMEIAIQESKKDIHFQVVKDYAIIDGKKYKLTLIEE